MSLVEVGRYTTRVEADLARMLLESYDIDAILFDSEVHSYLGTGLMMPVRLMTLAEDEAEALAILTANGRPQPG